VPGPHHPFRRRRPQHVEGLPPGLGGFGWLAGVAYAIAMCVALSSALRRSAATSLGPANRVTLARATLVGLITALVAGGSGLRLPAVLVTVAALALILDQVDGFVARRTGSVSALGARFDMEVDAFLILVLSIAVSPSVGAWVLTIGALRYAFGAAARVLPWLRAPLPPSLAKKGVAGLQGAVLLVVSAGVLPFPAEAAMLAVALMLLLWSFGRDILWLWRGRRRQVPSYLGRSSSIPASRRTCPPGAWKDRCGSGTSRTVTPKAAIFCLISSTLSVFSSR
jgi:phosphatidylglycerophosphate synthase